MQSQRNAGDQDNAGSGGADTLRLALVSAYLLLRLPFEKIDGNPAPTIIFKGRPAFFHALILSLDFAFSGATVTICLHSKCPKMGGYFWWLSCTAMVVAAGMMAWCSLALSLRPIVGSMPLHQLAYY